VNLTGHEGTFGPLTALCVTVHGGGTSR